MRVYALHPHELRLESPLQVLEAVSQLFGSPRFHQLILVLRREWLGVSLGMSWIVGMLKQHCWRVAMRNHRAQQPS